MYLKRSSERMGRLPRCICFSQLPLAAFLPYGTTFKALPSGQTTFSPYGKTFLAICENTYSSGTPLRCLTPYGNRSASDSVTQNRNRRRSGGTQYSKMTHWVPLEVPRRPIPDTESDAKSLKTRHKVNYLRRIVSSTHGFP